MANTKTSAMTALTGTGRISRPAARAGSTTDYRTVDNFTAAADPAVTDDVTDGYHAGSVWFNTTDNKLFVCQDPTDGAAVWRQVMDASKNLSDLADAATSRNNLGGIFPPMDPDYNDSAVYLTMPVLSAPSTGALIANQLVMAPIWVPRTRTFTTYAMTLTVLSGSTGIRVGLYNSNSSLQPTTKIDEGATVIDSSTGTGATGLKTVAFGVNQSLKPGLYYVAYLSDGGPTVARTNSTAAMGLGSRFSASAITPNGCKIRAGVAYAALPADETAQAYVSQASLAQSVGIVGIR